MFRLLDVHILRYTLLYSRNFGFKFKSQRKISRFWENEYKRLRKGGFLGHLYDEGWLSTEDVKVKWKSEWQAAKQIRQSIKEQCMQYTSKLIEADCHRTLRKIYRSKPKTIPNANQKFSYKS